MPCPRVSRRRWRVAHSAAALSCFLFFFFLLMRRSSPKAKGNGLAILGICYAFCVPSYIDTELAGPSPIFIFWHRVLPQSNQTVFLLSKNLKKGPLLGLAPFLPPHSWLLHIAQLFFFFFFFCVNPLKKISSFCACAVVTKCPEGIESVTKWCFTSHGLMMAAAVETMMSTINRYPPPFNYPPQVAKEEESRARSCFSLAKYLFCKPPFWRHLSLSHLILFKWQKYTGTVPPFGRYISGAPHMSQVCQPLSFNQPFR